ncbi:1,6-anhydro-N-acetylmuramyl-L-alanine amidase AmpD [Algiphilus sp.]|uniref:1,6-anhydro-N-acetylmuramyl-L-alanine amidase AmpD n=1 Tax=Algiphilus sp. TaxID=1872431 RepID=UPI003B52054A
MSARSLLPKGLVPEAWQVDPVHHRLDAATVVESPHQDARPGGVGDIDTIVVHAISLPPGEYGGGWIDRLFQGDLPASAHPYFASLQGLRVSAHLCIFRDGGLHQYVGFDARAWHAGASDFDGRPRVNDFSIGIELEGCDDDGFTDAQYTALARAIRALMNAYPAITPARLVGHADIAPGRKTDPGPGFEWTRLLAELRYRS